MANQMLPFTGVKYWADEDHWQIMLQVKDLQTENARNAAFHCSDAGRYNVPEGFVLYSAFDVLGNYGFYVDGNTVTFDGMWPGDPHDLPTLAAYFGDIVLVCQEYVGQPVLG